MKKQIIILALLGFVCANTFAQIKVDSIGQVGIGNSSPSSLFSVGTNSAFQINSIGNVKTYMGTYSTPSYSFTASPSTGMYSPATNELAFSTNGTSRLKINSTGNFAFGAANINSSYLMALQNPTSVSNGINLTLSGATATSYGMYMSFGSYRYRGIFVTNSSNSTSASNTFFGFGSALTAGQASETYLSYRKTSGETFGIYAIGGNYAGVFRGKTVVTSKDNPNSISDFEIQNTSTLNTVNVSFRPTTQVYTKGNVIANLNFGAGDSTLVQARIRVLRDETASTGDGDHPTAITFSTIQNGTDSLAERLRIHNNGNVSIGDDNNWGEKLMVGAERFNDVNETAFATYVNHTDSFVYAQVSYVNHPLTKALAVKYNNTDVFKVYGSGDVIANSYTPSDISLKENIADIQNPLTTLFKLKGVKYNYKKQKLSSDARPNTIISEENPKKQIGLIAQDVELIVPEVVRTDENGIKAIAYQNLVPLIIEAMKEQQNRIETLEKELDKCCTKNTNKSLLNDNSTIEEPKTTASYINQNRPNPFANETVIDYFVAENANNSAILIFDMNGKLLRTKTINTTGKGAITIYGSELAAGMYYYSLVVDNKEIDTKKMILTE